MIASWMLYALLVGGMVVTAAHLAEVALRRLGRPVRGVWIAALIAIVALPLATALLPPRVAAPVAERGLADTAAPANDPPLAASLAAYTSAPSLDRPLLAAWALLTLTLLGALAYGIGVLQGRRREWRSVVVDGREVLVAQDLGPAVIGWRRMRVVLPTWALALPADDRRLILTHEDQHIRRRDPQLLLAGLCAGILVPWNLALWYGYRRLRLAVELDCDARVIEGGADVARYGEVLLLAGARCRGGRLPALATFAERAVHLETRLTALTPLPVRGRRLRAALAGTAVIALVGVACTVPNPLGFELTDPSNAPAVRLDQTQARAIEWRAVVNRLVESQYPGAVVRGEVPEPLTVMLVTRLDGGVVEVAATTTAHGLPDIGKAVDPARIASIDVMKGGVTGIRNVSVIVVALRAQGETGAARTTVRMPPQSIATEQPDRLP